MDHTQALHEAWTEEFRRRLSAAIGGAKESGLYKGNEPAHFVRPFKHGLDISQHRNKFLATGAMCLLDASLSVGLGEARFSGCEGALVCASFLNSWTGATLDDGVEAIIGLVNEWRHDPPAIEVGYRKPQGDFNRTVIIVTRHRGALEWLAKYLHPELPLASVVTDERGTRLEYWQDARDGECCLSIPVISSAKPQDVDGKVVIGNLPLNLASCAAEVIAIEFSGTPPRGEDYGRTEMEAAGAKLRKYRVERV